MLLDSGCAGVKAETQDQEPLLFISAFSPSPPAPPQAVISCSISWEVYKARLLACVSNKKENLQFPSSLLLSCYDSFLLLQLFLILLFDLWPRSDFPLRITAAFASSLSLGFNSCCIGRNFSKDQFLEPVQRFDNFFFFRVCSFLTLTGYQGISVSHSPWQGSLAGCILGLPHLLSQAPSSTVHK